MVTTHSGYRDRARTLEGRRRATLSPILFLRYVARMRAVHVDGTVLFGTVACPASVITAALLLFASSSTAQVMYLDEQFGFTHTSSVVYAIKPVGSPPVDFDLLLELYEPSGPGVPTGRPAVIAIHGGSFTGGSRFSAVMIGICERMARLGYTCVSIDYRLLGQAPVVGPSFQLLEALVAFTDPTRATAIAAATEDTVAALQWLLDNAVEFDIAPFRVILTGNSAGGALTEFVAYVANDTGVVLPAQPRATFNIAGSFDPSFQVVAADEAALLIAHGDLDTVVPVAGAFALRDQAVAAGVANELLVLSGKGHGNFDLFTDEVAPGETIFERFVTFAYQHVVPAPAVPALSGPGLVLLSLAISGLGLAIGRSRRPDALCDSRLGSRRLRR